ncbi:MAG: methyltransferase [Candidatus Woesearchaeota archaeon]
MPKQDVQGLYDSRAKTYEISMMLAGYHRLLHFSMRRLEKTTDFPPQPRVLDIGCGTGMSTRICRAYIPDAEFVGMDASANMLAKYVETNPTAFIGDFNNPETISPFEEGNAEKPLHDYRPFSLAIATASVTEYGGQEPINLTYDLLEENGKMLIIGMRDNLLAQSSGYFWEYKPSGLEKTMERCEEAGFSKLEEISIGLWFPLLRKHKFVLLAEK